MDLLDRIAALLRILFGDAGSTGRPPGSGPGARTSGGSSARSADPDLAAAWDELNDYLGADRGETGQGGPRGGAQNGGRGPQSSPSPLESLRPDYANLEVPFGADIETVRRSYKRLVLRYHPDRHAGDPEKVRVATEITKKVNESFERIRSFLKRTGAGDR
ncbi:MAG: J domain-containing protein [Spirochaetes bacterium]|nr:J domain-containing protein [Spirochaetota bacterium]